MNDAIWIAGVLALTLAGAWATRIEFVRRLEFPARLAIAFTCGLATTGLLLAVRLPWTRATLLIAMAVGAALWRRGERMTTEPRTWILFAAIAILTCYGSLAARQTTGDLLFFWGPKAVHFYEAGRIDFEFLATPHYFLMHSDYPPLLPLVYAAGNIAAHEMSWWGAILFSSICIIAAALAFRGIARTRLGERRASAFATLLLATLAYGIATSNAAGGADALLYLFAVVAIAALTFEDHRLLAAITLTALVLVKVEGLPFAMVILGGWLITRRKVVDTLTIAIAPLIAIGVWIVVVYRFNIQDAYTVGRKPFRPDHLDDVIRWVSVHASYRAAWLPWIAALVPFAFAQNLRRAAFPLVVAGGTLAVTLLFYLQGNDSPEWWIAASAERVLLTPLASLIVAAAASSADETLC
ncbi:MAG TPA: hypothetical protein VGF48_09000 [Thermoanaerobaculia bacterium]|jgi:hypothetical protein